MKPVRFFPTLILVSLFLSSFGLRAHAQARSFVSGPMLGQVEIRTVSVWAEFASGVSQVRLRVWPASGDPSKALVRSFQPNAQQGFFPMRMDLGGLEPGTAYRYQVEAVTGGKAEKKEGSFTTKELWQWRKPVPDVRFLAGSCSYVNEPQYDRPGKPYGGDSSIYASMAREKADFMLWLGDNWYTREVDYHSRWGLWYRASHDRAVPVLQPFLAAMPHYAIWDDHDFGPNDIGSEYVLKDESRAVFMHYWANPSYGEEDMGIYTKISYGDVDVFMLDDRTWRASDRLSDSVDGKPNPLKVMFGAQQMRWLKNALSASAANFKVIATGSQVLNPASPFDCFRRFPAEYHELMAFLREEKITGVMFLTGDRHHSEIIRVEGLLGYPLFDITASPLTSGTHEFGASEKNNPFRVYGLDQKQNYAVISVTGVPRERVMTIQFRGINGEILGEYNIPANSLRLAPGK
jgi:alkaline phosphatase D